MKYYEKKTKKVVSVGGQLPFVDFVAFVKSNNDKHIKDLKQIGYEESEYARQYFQIIKRGQKSKENTPYLEEKKDMPFFDWDMQKIEEFNRKKDANIDYKKMEEINLKHSLEIQKIKNKISALGHFNFDKVAECFGNFEEFWETKIIVKPNYNVTRIPQLSGYMAYIDTPLGTEFSILVDDKTSLIKIVTINEVDNYYKEILKKEEKDQEKKESKILQLEKYYKDHYKTLKKDLEIKDLLKKVDIIYILAEEDIVFREKNSFYTENADISSSNIEACFKDLKEAINIYEEKKDTFNFNIYNRGISLMGSNLHLFSYDKNGDIKTIKKLSCIDEYKRIKKLVSNHNEKVEQIQQKILNIGKVNFEKIAETFIDFEEFGKKEIIVQKSKNKLYDYIAYIDTTDSTEFLIKVDKNNNITDVTIDRSIDALQDYFYATKIDEINLEEIQKENDGIEL